MILVTLSHHLAKECELSAYFRLALARGAFTVVLLGTRRVKEMLHFSLV
jgi:hypothetical protein